MSVADTTSPSREADLSALDFRFDPEISQQVLDETIATLSRGNPQFAEVVAQELGSRNIVEEYRQTFSPLGLRHDNLAHTMAAYWIAMWSIIHNKPLASPTQTAAVLSQVGPRVRASALARSARQRQMMGEALIYEAQLGYRAYLDARDSNQQLQLRQMARSASRNAKEKGIDLKRMRLTERGMQRR